MAHIPVERDWIDGARRRQAGSVTAKRFGRPGESGTAWAFVCGVRAGYISGVNLRLDGGSCVGLV
jgi:3-oxoacyl-[acyl-carrier protein] reductase